MKCESRVDVNVVDVKFTNRRCVPFTDDLTCDVENWVFERFHTWTCTPDTMGLCILFVFVVLQTTIEVSFVNEIPLRPEVYIVP